MEGHAYSKANHAIDALRNRGPDNQTILCHEDITMAHTRLSIIDLNDRSNQPFETDRAILIANGEIYNYKELRYELEEDFAFQTEGDCEVILALYETQGVDAFAKLNGMFAFVIYDKDKKELYFMRDAVGIKPLYFTVDPTGVLELSSLQSAFSWKGPFVKDRLDDILAFGYPRVPLYFGMYEAEPGVVYNGKLQTYYLNYEFKDTTFKEAIQRQFVTSDVPVGITLSGGVDSAYIAYIANEIEQVSTFTIGFDESDEDILASRDFADKYETNHTEIIIDREDIGKYYPVALETLEIPMDMGSTVHTYLLAKEIQKQGIKVIMIGEGSDELNAGYSRHATAVNEHGLRGAWTWYQNKVIKHDPSERNKILGTNSAVNPYMSTVRRGTNKILEWDFENELRYYHLKRIDHIVSDFGIEARVPYLDLPLVFQMRRKQMHEKIGKRLLRMEAAGEGLAHQFSCRPKKPLKLMKDMKSRIAQNVTNEIAKQALVG